MGVPIFFFFFFLCDDDGFLGCHEVTSKQYSSLCSHFPSAITTATVTITGSVATGPRSEKKRVRVDRNLIFKICTVIPIKERCHERDQYVHPREVVEVDLS